jgi:hypothetical protein
MEPWADHLYKTGAGLEQFKDPPEHPERPRRSIEPWLSAVLQSEHLSLLVGSGLPLAVGALVDAPTVDMSMPPGPKRYAKYVEAFAKAIAAKSERGAPNIQDHIRAVVTLAGGLSVLSPPRGQEMYAYLGEVMANFVARVLASEAGIVSALESDSAPGLEARMILESFLLTFASRAGSRERLSIFTTNYDRLIETGCDLAGLRALDRFVGSVHPVFRSSRLDIDLHYNPPGIRGEPRYLEGVVKLTKLHGSIDWRASGRTIRRHAFAAGAKNAEATLLPEEGSTVMVYPNPAKDWETLNYPYAELFRDFSATLCRPNSALITYGYGFGDDHINRVIEDMMTIPSTHLAILSFDRAGGRIQTFCERVGRGAQLSLLMGSHFGDLSTLVKLYLPKPAVDVISWRRTELLKRRGIGLAGDQEGPEEGATQ